jgi:hypothetical protein
MISMYDTTIYFYSAFLGVGVKQGMDGYSRETRGLIV